MTRRIQILCIVALVSVAIWGCSRDASMPTAPDQLLADKDAEAVPLTAIVQVNISPEGLSAPFIIEGPGDIVLTGDQTTTFTGNHPGRYSIYWGEVPGYTTPDFQTYPVGPGKTIVFEGDYEGGGGGEEAMGMFFANETTYAEAAFMGVIEGYVLYKNPTQAAVRGFECGWDLDDPLGSSINSTVDIAFPLGGIDVGECSTVSDKYNIIVGFEAPLLTNGSTVLATLTFNIYDFDKTIQAWFRPADPCSTPDALPCVLDVDYNVVPVDMAQDQGDAALTIVVAPM